MLIILFISSSKLANTVSIFVVSLPVLSSAFIVLANAVSLFSKAVSNVEIVFAIFDIDVDALEKALFNAGFTVLLYCVFIFCIF